MVSRLTPKRQERVDRHGSPPFTFTAGVIPALGIVRIYVRKQFPLAAKYDPLDTTDFINNSTERLAISFNGETENPRIVPGNTIAQFENQAVNQFQIINQDAVNATAAGEVFVTFSRAALDADEFARRWGGRW